MSLLKKCLIACVVLAMLLAAATYGAYHWATTPVPLAAHRAHRYRPNANPQVPIDQASSCLPQIGGGSATPSPGRFLFLYAMSTYLARRS